MFPRLVTAAIGLPVLAALVWVGGYWFTGLVVILSAVASWELCRMAGAWGQRPLTLLAIVLTVAFVAAGNYVAGLDQAGTFGVIAGGAALSAAIAMMLAPHAVRKSLATTLVTVCIVLFIGGALFNAVLLGGAPDGREWILFLIIVTFATDTGAYIIGKAIGSRMLAPNVSPGKTWEGAVGGLVGAISAGAIFGWVTGAHPADGPWLMLAPILGISGQVGDLYESRLKRMARFDDSGSLVPGHGGVLDRLDSITFNLIVLGMVVITLS